MVTWKDGNVLFYKWKSQGVVGQSPVGPKFNMLEIYI
jgi:hypothetical protein